ncbi:hypothetical protein BKA64DRAFT_648651 [Cadophora sp. MPI-SDFR-AT-0126]|nr:hypothetical protein BKA64DRAFT_648651 [Leotiomycetes sp. MPI-SDFR-AT-0126]
MFPLATIVLLLRLYTRIVIVRKVGVHDTHPTGFLLTLSSKATHLGPGVHIWDVPFTMFSPDLLRPVAKNWGLTITKGKFINVSKILLARGSINVVTDLAMPVLPIALVWKLKVKMKQKVALVGLFKTGTLVCIVSAIRLKLVWDLIRSPDFTWLGAELNVWSVLEVYIGIICVCAEWVLAENVADPLDNAIESSIQASK